MEKMKILVVDDESRMRKLIRDFLEREGYAVLEAENGLNALDVFYENKDIALMILDVIGNLILKLSISYKKIKILNIQIL